MNKNYKYYLSFDLGLTGFYSLIKIENNKFEILESNKIIVELKEDKLFKVNDKTKSKAMIKNQISFIKNYLEIKEMLIKYNIEKNEVLCFAEQLSPRPFNSRISILSLGDSGGTIRSIIESLNLEYLIISPGTWKKHLNITSDKETSINLFKECINENRIATHTKELFKSFQDKKLNFNHNQIESILIAYWFFNYKF